MGWTPRWHRCAKVVVLEDHLQETSMGDGSIIGLDLAKNVFQVHVADASGTVLLRRKLRHSHLLEFFAAQPRCTVAMEACASAHYWAREPVWCMDGNCRREPRLGRPFGCLRTAAELKICHSNTTPRTVTGSRAPSTASRTGPRTRRACASAAA
jgi:hypothetical protein